MTSRQLLSLTTVFLDGMQRFVSHANKLEWQILSEITLRMLNFTSIT